MAQRQLPPRYAVRYEDMVLSKPATAGVGDERAGGQDPDIVHERQATTLAGARSIQRALQRRGHRVQGIYERLNLHFRSLADELKPPECWFPARRIRYTSVQQSLSTG
jgi:hypothetical protein